MGAGVGAASFVTPLYIAEVAPAQYRGRLVTVNVLFITAGQVVAYVVGWIFAEHAGENVGWRWMVGLGAIPAALQAVLVMAMPETPRWLVMAGRSAEAKAVIHKVSGESRGRTRRLADVVVKDIEVEIREEGVAGGLRWSSHGPWTKLLRGWKELLTVGRNRRALAIACLLQGLQQLSGFVSY